jgi:hypothetical protein
MTILVGVGSGKREDQGEIVGSGQESRIREALGTAEVGMCHADFGRLSNKDSRFCVVNT